MDVLQACWALNSQQNWILLSFHLFSFYDNNIEFKIADEVEERTWMHQIFDEEIKIMDLKIRIMIQAYCWKKATATRNNGRNVDPQKE